MRYLEWLCLSLKHHRSCDVRHVQVKVVGLPVLELTPDLRLHLVGLLEGVPELGHEEEVFPLEEALHLDFGTSGLPPPSRVRTAHLGDGSLHALPGLCLVSVVGARVEHAVPGLDRLIHRLGTDILRYLPHALLRKCGSVMRRIWAKARCQLTMPTIGILSPVPTSVTVGIEVDMTESVIVTGDVATVLRANSIAPQPLISLRPTGLRRPRQALDTCERNVRVTASRRKVNTLTFFVPVSCLRLHLLAVASVIAEEAALPTCPAFVALGAARWSAPVSPSVSALACLQDQIGRLLSATCECRPGHAF